MKPDQLAQIEERLNKTTPGEWRFVDGELPSIKRIIGVSFPIPIVMWALDLNPAQEIQRESDGQFIAHAKSDITALIEDNKALRTALREAGEALKHYAYIDGGKSLRIGCGKALDVLSNPILWASRQVLLREVPPTKKA